MTMHLPRARRMANDQPNVGPCKNSYLIFEKTGFYELGTYKTAKAIISEKETTAALIRSKLKEVS